MKTLTINDIELTIAQWAKVSGTNATTIHARLKRGYTPEAAVFDTVMSKAQAGRIGASKTKHMRII